MRIDVPEILCSAGVISADAKDMLVAAIAKSGGSADTVAIEEGFASEHQVLRSIGDYLEIPFKEDLDSFEIPMVYVEKVPLAFARSNNIVAFGQRGATFLLATSSPFNFRALDNAAAMLSADVEPVFAPSEVISSLISRGYQMQSSGLGAVLNEMDSDIIGISSKG